MTVESKSDYTAMVALDRDGRLRDNSPVYLIPRSSERDFMDKYNFTPDCRWVPLNNVIPLMGTPNIPRMEKQIGR